MTPATWALIDLLIKVLIYSLIVATPLLVLIITMYVYQRYRKWKIKEKLEPERQIVKILNNKETSEGDTPKTTEEILVQAAGMMPEEELLNTVPEVDELDELSDDVSFDKMSIKELHTIAKERGIKGFSRMKKKDLISKLS